MSRTATPQAPATSQKSIHRQRTDVRRSWRRPVVLVMAVSLLATGLLQYVAQEQRRALVSATPTGATANASLSNLNSFSLALLLGGLRGPLVMVLWTSSENQKQEKDLDDFDTKIELIRLLQPEFDSVHIFQIWNKAYNISVQMASLANKYATILDALGYAEKIDAQRPNDINLVASIGQLYFDKLGSSQEKVYYTQRVMAETKWRLPDKRKAGDPGWRRFRLDPMLDPAGNILPHYLEPHPAASPIAPSAEGELNDGSELQYIKQFQPFPYGVHPMALGYNYYKRTQVLKDTTHQKHLQLSDLVIDDRPAVTLKLWAESEWERGRRLEAQAFAKELPEPGTGDRGGLELPTAPMVSAKDLKDSTTLLEPRYCYQRAAQLGVESRKEYERHLKHFGNSINQFRFHQDGLTAMEALVLGDYDALSLVAGAAPDRAGLKASAIDHYRKAAAAYEYMLLKNYTDDETVAQTFPKGVTRVTLQMETLPPEKLAELLQRSTDYAKAHGRLDLGGDRKEYESYLGRALIRLSELQRQSPG